MKKIVSIIALTLGAGVAFAVTDAQKTAFVEKIKTDFLPAAEGQSYHEKLTATYTAMKSATDPIVTWALAEPEAYYKWSGETGLGGHVQWLVRWNLRTQNPSVELTDLQDAAIDDSEGIIRRARASKSDYNALKVGGFKVGSIPVSAWKSMTLAEQYGDPEAFDSFKTEQVANEFGRYYNAILKANVSSDAETAWKRLVKARKTFSLYRNLKNGDGSLKYPKISENWTSLIADEDSAYVDYKRSK